MWNGVLQLDEAAYKRFQEMISTINIELNKLKYCKEAGAQTSSWSKVKGKIVKYTGGVFMILVASEIGGLDNVVNFDFDTHTFDDFSAVVEPAVRAIQDQPEGKCLTVEALTYGANWAMMFHETGLKLQNCMVAKGVLPRMASHAGSSSDGAGVVTEETSNVAASRPKPKEFAGPLQWGVHAVLSSTKFEDGIVSASYMCTSNARLLKGSALQLTGGGSKAGGVKPTFHAVAKQLETDGLAEIVREKTAGKPGSKLSLAGAKEKPIWGVRLRAPSSTDAEDAFETILAPYLLTFEEYSRLYAAISPEERDRRFEFKLLKNYMLNPPEAPAVVAPVPMQSEPADGGTVHEPPMSLAAGQALEAQLSAIASPGGARRSPRNSGQAPENDGLPHSSSKRQRASPIAGSGSTSTVPAGPSSAEQAASSDGASMQAQPRRFFASLFG